MTREKTFLVSALSLIVLFTLVEPDETARYGIAMSLLFWTCHIGTGLVILYLASYWIRNKVTSKLSPLTLVSISGLIGAVICAPIYTWFDVIFPSVDKASMSWLSNKGQESTAWALLEEFTQMGPIFLASWFIMNIPLFTRKNTPYSNEKVEKTEQKSYNSQKENENKKVLLDKLPSVIGRDIVSVSSDLHYINIETAKGKALILGSIKAVAEVFQNEGIQVHRSHWVAYKHVSKLHINGDKAYCLTSTGSKIPVSRSKRKAVKDAFGTQILLSHTLSKSGSSHEQTYQHSG
ncbi:LytTR family DNA-binding domain-containing protein [Teredinibacter sp. KSP-S5-2]|uniref:LytTR family DNA-binding domain-containing protein n=1 Tax=Teredinibacter sp. KSP-S5-2 TaxID=3034506 RepID=UPI0029352AD1|nr:LytTR family DNA-binding domain-containing protein [Teredinibacter sp. KSP-S5-2]WNO07628.1 LytTR family DNA-binding domain-containing protein [Teredinibacter sp. KSP-S5-2]